MTCFLARGVAAMSLFALALPGVALADCPASAQAITGPGLLHYPSINDCPTAINAAETVSQSYHYQKACSDTFGTPIGSFPYNDWHSVENVWCNEAINQPGFSTGTVVEVTVCCTHGPDLADLLDDMVTLLQGPCSVPGAAALINHLNDVIALAVDSHDDYQLGNISLGQHLIDLTDALGDLAQFDNLLQVKINIGQMTAPCSTDLQAMSAQVNTMINADILSH